MASAAVDLNQQRSDSSLASKSTRPLGQIIGLTPGDNPSDDKTSEAVVKCNHFSIRGYVAQVRKRDPKLCDPFSPYLSHDGSTETSHELPPMVVPKFRWWQCDSCIPEAGTSKGIAEEAQKSVDETKQKSKVDAPKERNTEASTSTDSNDNRNDTPSSTMHADLKGKGKAHVEDEPTPHTGCENGFLKDSLSHGIQQQNVAGVEAIRFADDEGVRRSQLTGNGNIESHQMNHIPERIEIGPSKERLNHENGNFDQTPMKEKVSLEGQPSGALIKGIGTQVAGIVEGRGPSGDGKGRIVSLPDLNEFNGEPTDDDENEVLAAGNSNLCEEDDDYLGADRRKTPKVRLLSELLGLNENQNDAKLKRKNPSFSSFPGPSACKSTVSDSPGPSSMNENAKRKRTGSQDDESRSLEIKGSINGTKKLRTPQIESSESESEDESTEIISKAVTKSRNRSTLEKIPFSEKRSKKIKFDHGSPSVSRHKIISKPNQEKGKPPEKRVSVDAATFKPPHGDIPRKNDSSAQVDERNVLLTKAKGKMIQAGKEQTFLSPSKNHVLRDGATEKDKEAIQSSNGHVLNEQSQDGSPAKGTYLFPDRYFTMGNDYMSVAPGKNGLYPHSSQVDHTLLNGGVVIKHTENRNSGVTNISFTSPNASSFMGTTRFDAYTERSTGPKLNSKGRPVWIPETGEGGSMVHHSLKQVSNSVNNQKELTNEVRGRIQDIDINSLPTDDKVPEQGTGDDNQDIPMDIVELMAKHQYERNLGEPKDNRNQVTVAASYGKTVWSNGSSSAYGDNMSKLGQPCFLSMQNPNTTNARNSMVNGFDDMGYSRLNLLSPFSDLNQNHVGFRGHVRENQVSSMSLSAGQGHDHVSAYSTLDSSPNNWNRHMTTPRYLPSSFSPPVDSYNRYRAPSPRPNIDAHVWPSMVANRMPLGITNPEMIPQSSKSMNKGRMHHQGPSILNFSAANLGKQNMNFSSAYSSGPVESSGSGAGASRLSGKQRGVDYPPKAMGSVDLYSNDAIPAMHLLSLMQNAAKIQPPVPLSIDGKADLVKRPPNLPNHQYKQLTAGTHETSPIKVGTSSSRQSLLENNGRTSMPENSCHPCYPALPPARPPFASPFQSDGGGYGRNAGFISPIPLTSRGQRNIESSHFITPSGDYRSQKSVPCDVVRKRPFSSANDKGKGIAGVSSPLQPSKDSSNFLHGVATKRDEKTTHRSPDKEICVVNRNPSEFNDLKELSRYTIRPEDLRPGGPIREKPTRPRGDAKRLEMRMNKPMSIPSGKERDRQRKL